MGVGTEPEEQEQEPLKPADNLLLGLFDEEIKRQQRKIETAIPESAPLSEQERLKENIKLVKRVINSMSITYLIPEKRLIKTLKRAKGLQI